jgi:hypothetical protein
MRDTIPRATPTQIQSTQLLLLSAIRETKKVTTERPKKYMDSGSIMDVYTLIGDSPVKIVTRTDHE